MCECLHVSKRVLIGTQFGPKGLIQDLLAWSHLILGIGKIRVKFVFMHVVVEMEMGGARKSIQKLLRYFSLDESHKSINTVF